MVLLQLVVLLFCLSSQSFYMLYILLFLNQEKTILIFIRRSPQDWIDFFSQCELEHQLTFF